MILLIKYVKVYNVWKHKKDHIEQNLIQENIDQFMNSYMAITKCCGIL